MPLLDVRNLSVDFITGRGKLHAVRNISFSLEQGEVLGIVGESGSGKSVTAYAILNLLPGNGVIPEGSVLYREQNVLEMKPAELSSYRGKEVSIIFQEPGRSFDPIYSIGKALSETLLTHEPGLSKEELYEKSIRLLEEVNIPQPGERLSNYPHQFSGGMLQRIMIALALASNPRVLIADEPTTSLDVTIQAGIIDLLLRLKEERNLSIIFITHNLPLLSGFTDSLVVMYGGKIMEKGAAKTVLSAPESDYTKFLLGSILKFGDHHTTHKIHNFDRVYIDPYDENPDYGFRDLGAELLESEKSEIDAGAARQETGAPGTGSPRTADADDPGAYNGRTVSHGGTPVVSGKPGAAAGRIEGPGGHAGPKAGNGGVEARRTDERADAVLGVRGLTKRYSLEAGFFAKTDRFIYAVNGISFSIDRNEIYGLVGESGCGKTTTARLIVNMFDLTDGDIVFRDREQGDIRIRGIGKRDQKILRSRIKYIFQDPARSLNPRMSVLDVLTSGYRYSPFWPGADRAREEAADIMKAVGLHAGDLERRPADFSGGQRQRISIARALIMKPRVLICDEVVSALDVSIQGQILNLLLKVKEEFGLSMLFIAHDLSVVSYIADRVGVMYRGKLVEEAPSLDLIRERLHPYTRHLYASIPRMNEPMRRGADLSYGERWDPTAHPVSEEDRAAEELAGDGTRDGLEYVGNGRWVSRYFRND